MLDQRGLGNNGGNVEFQFGQSALVFPRGDNCFDNPQMCPGIVSRTALWTVATALVNRKRGEVANLRDFLLIVRIVKRI